MKIRKALAVFAVVGGMAMAACVPISPVQDTTPATTTPVASTQVGSDPQNATYLIEGEAITLVDGSAETELAPGSASKQVTTYFGNEVEVDLNSDGLIDSAFILVVEGGGSGTFYYVAATLQTADGYAGTNALFLGDRIAPLMTMPSRDNPAHVVVRYLDRLPDEAMASEPTHEVAKTFTVEDGLLVEVVTP
jgi:hypothetical protein